MGQASTRSLTWPQEKQNRKRAKEDLIVMQQRSAAAAVGYDAQGAVGRQKAAGIAALALSSCCSLHRERERQNTERRKREKRGA
jgi:hypothetical protein